MILCEWWGFCLQYSKGIKCNIGNLPDYKIWSWDFECQPLRTLEGQSVYWVFKHVYHIQNNIRGCWREVLNIIRTTERLWNPTNWKIIEWGRDLDTKQAVFKSWAFMSSSKCLRIYLLEVFSRSPNPWGVWGGGV